MSCAIFFLEPFAVQLAHLIWVWFAEAGASGAFPLDDRSAVEIITTPRLTPPRNRYVYTVVDIPAPGASGVIFSMGSRFGGHALYVKKNRLHYVNNFVGSIEQQIVGSEDIPTGTNVILSAAFDKDGNDPDGATGTLTPYHGDRKVGEGQIKTQLGAFAIAGASLYVGRDPGEAITEDYPGTSPFAFTGGTIDRVAIDVSGEPYLDLEREAALMLMRE